MRKRGFSSRLGFILATAGSAVGLGNIWAFPFVAGENGGGGFVFVFILALLVIAVPAMVAELLLGRLGQASPPEALRSLQDGRRSLVPWSFPAWVGVISTIFILSFYSVIAGQAMYYGYLAFVGGFEGLDGSAIAQIDTDFKSGMTEPGLWAAVFIAACAYFVGKGVKAGVERAARLMMPALFIMILGLTLYATIIGDMAAALDFMFGVRVDEITLPTIFNAVGQAFFTLSVGVGGLMMMGAYMGEDVNLPRAVAIIAVMDLAVALLAGLMIFPLVFASNLDASAGPGLIFMTTPLLFATLPFGKLLAVLFYLLITFAALTSGISLMAPSVQRLEEFGVRRSIASVAIVFVVSCLATLTTFSLTIGHDFYPLESFGLPGLTFFDLIREGVNNIILPFGGLAFVLIAGWGLGRERVRKALPVSDGPIYRLWFWGLQYVVPAGILLLFLSIIS